MDSGELMRRIARIVEAHGTGVLATVDHEGAPHARWLTPALLPGRPGVVYALTSPGFAKVAQLRANPRVEWLFQTPSLDEVISLRGTLGVIDNPSLRAEVQEALGPRLATFWRLAPEGRGLVVLETVVSDATLYLPLEGGKDVVRF
jgi:general stress protein 26